LVLRLAVGTIEANGTAVTEPKLKKAGVELETKRKTPAFTVYLTLRKDGK